MPKPSTYKATRYGTNPPPIDAMPTKELFIYMLTRDIGLTPAIIDLADNSGDGVRKLRGDKSWKNFWIRIEISNDRFRISDNCGGISIETARKYAFRFGRPLGSPRLKHSIGQFGVGMKRAIFKLGRHFRVESKTTTERFVVSQDVERWASNPEWHFAFESTDSSTSRSLEKTGTTIEVSKLHEDVADAFVLENFQKHLKEQLRSRLSAFISKGLGISLNGVPIDADPIRILSSQSLSPAYLKRSFDVPGHSKVTVKLYCGLGSTRDREEAGWHVFCNGRLILAADQTKVTGWGDESNGLRIPGFHGQYNLIRGYAFFDSDDSGSLPWNTTKTDLNPDSRIYRSVRLDMMRLMRPVVDFLNRLKNEKEERGEQDTSGPLETLLQTAKDVRLQSVQPRDSFHIPKTIARKQIGPDMQRIQYEKPVDQVKAVMKALGASSYKKAGEKTFEYYYNAEIEE